ncbi:hypothetical protein [Arthrobacter sp. B2a2-09]|uniref:hypothetical protein n=1 Tax=Arthrobacter sp. B2a2-09 TaxID=2952822 RepID=UPI0022CD67DE|nr:hypothetical protein [Arthrobacter sp. B2a2-09]MCZ9884258.1 hypothetical protein [Arthrobacter sp. B2a2-09]
MPTPPEAAASTSSFTSLAAGVIRSFGQQLVIGADWGKRPAVRHALSTLGVSAQDRTQAIATTDG